ncbi:MAG: hypothetical protein IPP14_12315 [Planctomycetes bacterium]|nr:hypothetical protein [Planctomycetota bacterium]
MAAPRHNRAVIAAMLLAALACYANAPRLAATLLIGDATNFVSVLHAGSHSRLNAQLASLPESSPQACALQSQLQDGSHSIAVLESLPPLPGVLAADWLRAKVDAAPGTPPKADSCVLPLPLVAIAAGSIHSASQPPPPWPGIMACHVAAPTGVARSALARGPPVWA